MPSRIPRPCAEPGCVRLVRDHSRCGVHRKLRRKHEARRRRREDPEVQAFYTSPRWRKVRKRYLARSPLCERCASEGETVPADVVHHKVPIRDGGERYSLDNLEALCHVHHNREHGGRTDA